MEKKQKEVTANPIKDLCISFFYWWYNTRGTNIEQGFDSWAQTEEGQQKIAALQSSQNFEKFSLYRETPTVATDHTVMEPSPTQEVENPDFEAYIKKLVYAFHSVGAFGFAPNSEYRWEDLWRKYRRDGILPQYNTHESNWKERLPLDEIIAALQSSPAQEVEKPDFEMLLKLSRLIQEQYEGLNEKQSDDIAAHIYNEAAVPLLKENQSLKARVKELEQEAFFIKLHRDSAQEDASSLRAIIKSLEAENESLKDRVKELEQEKKGVDAEYDSLVDLVTDYFMGGSGDTATLYEVEKFLRAHFKPMLSRIKSLEAENEELRKKGERDNDGLWNMP